MVEESCWLSPPACQAEPISNTVFPPPPHPKRALGSGGLPDCLSPCQLRIYHPPPPGTELCQPSPPFLPVADSASREVLQRRQKMPR